MRFEELPSLAALASANEALTGSAEHGDIEFPSCNDYSTRPIETPMNCLYAQAMNRKKVQVPGDKMGTYLPTSECPSNCSN